MFHSVIYLPSDGESLSTEESSDSVTTSHSLYVLDDDALGEGVAGGFSGTSSSSSSSPLHFCTGARDTFGA